MTLPTDRGGRYAPSCCHDHRKMTVIAAMFTMIFCSISVGLLVNDLIGVSNYVDRWQYGADDIKLTSNGTETEQQLEGEKELFNATISKVMYTVLICELVLLLISSVALLKGVYQKKQSLIMTWILIVFATFIYWGAVIIREFNLQGNTETVYAKSIMYMLFVIAEFGFMKYIILAFKEARRATTLRHTRGVAEFDPRNPDTAIFSIAGTMEQPDPEIVFKLPTYDEVTTEDQGESSSTSPRGKPPPYEPPPYVP